jgi:cell volume regulation protein A
VLSLIAGLVARRAGLPVLVAFLGVGMLMGSEGPGGIAFEDSDLARTVGVIALVVIIFEGALTTDLRDILPGVRTAALLSTVGVAVTAVVTGAAAYVLFDLPLLAAFLLGAVVASTDAAAVFATLRGTTLRRRVAGTLEAESGSNDPMAVALTLGLIAWLTTERYGFSDLFALVVRQLGLGGLIGVAIGASAAWAIRRMSVDLAPLAPILSLGIAALSYGAADAAGGSGFLAVYLVGLWLANTPSALRRSMAGFHQGLAYLAQVTLFVVLGLLVNPSSLLEVALPGLALAAVLILVARPVAVLTCTIRSPFDARERVLLGWAGLRGAVPIVLATFAATADIAAAATIFNAVFFVVLVSVLVQGPTIEPLARRLGLASERRPLYQQPSEIAAVPGADLMEIEVIDGDVIVGRCVRDLGLPYTSIVAMIVRERTAIPPRGRTRLEAGDLLYVLVRSEDRRSVEKLVPVWRDGPLPEAPVHRAAR